MAEAQYTSVSWASRADEMRRKFPRMYLSEGQRFCTARVPWNGGLLQSDMVMSGLGMVRWRVSSSLESLWFLSVVMIPLRE